MLRFHISSDRPSYSETWFHYLRLSLSQSDRADKRGPWHRGWHSLRTITDSDRCVCVVSALLCYHKNQSLWGTIIRHCLWFFSLIIWDNKRLESYPDCLIIVRINHGFMLMSSKDTFSSLKYSRQKCFIHYNYALQFFHLPIQMLEFFKAGCWFQLMNDLMHLSMMQFDWLSIKHLQPIKFLTTWRRLLTKLKFRGELSL